MKRVEEPLRCLFINAPFPERNFWNYTESCKLVGAKIPSPPLGLITAAALMPPHWTFKLMDLNTMPFSERLWRWADVICVGGMMSQQPGMLELIARARRDGRFIVVGGSGPSSQPELYQDADALILGEGEVTIPLWLESWRQGRPSGVFKSEERADVTRSPVPRFDLLKFSDYTDISVQYSRGCPFLCEFCDVIELYGRVPRTKTPQQMLTELEAIYQLGYRGQVLLTDDNFIGNKKNAKKFLPVLADWCREKDYPFFFSTEASMNMADDDELLRMLQAIDLRAVFMGIETPDVNLLKQTQKSQNTLRPIVERIEKLYAHGIMVAGSFIIGFDNEPEGMDAAILQLIEEAGICFTMIGMLEAMPNTQLYRRLMKEGRLLDRAGNPVREEGGAAEDPAKSTPQTRQVKADPIGDGGLNFVPTRDRRQIMLEYRNLLSEAYAPQRYMDRVMDVASRIRMSPKHRLDPQERRRALRGLVGLSVRMIRNPKTRWLYLRNLRQLRHLEPGSIEPAMKMMSLYLHFGKRTEDFIEHLDTRIARA